MQKGRRLAVDVGNTSLKCGIFEGRELVSKARFETMSVGELGGWAKRNGASRAIVSTVRKDGVVFCNALREVLPTHRLTSLSKLPFVNSYETPVTLGGDRLAGVAASAVLYPAQDVVVVDAGTAITCDYVSSDGVYEGGTISPGISMRFKALHEHTGALPLVGVESYSRAIGRTTEECIAAGVIDGVLAEVLGFLQKIPKFATGFQLILTGGDAEVLEKRLGRPCEVRQELVLEGLNALLEYNAE